MSDFPQKINNSYESGSSSSESASNLLEPQLNHSMHFEDMAGHKLTVLMLPTETDLYNSSVEEGIFPNVLNCQQIEVPSYQPDYDYINEYSNTPLVYSWLPIVPGFTQDGFDNLHNFQHLSDKNHQDCEQVTFGSQSVPNQNIKYHDFLSINKDAKLHNPQTGMDFGELENSCNAMDLDISCKEDAETTADSELSFNGRITELKAAVTVTDDDIIRKTEEPDESINHLEKSPIEQEITMSVNEVKEPVKLEVEVEETEEERQHNESFEVLKKEDSSKMLYINEKSPDLYNSRGEVLSDCEPREEADVLKPSGDCDTSILAKMRSSLAGICPPPSVTRFQMSLSEMLSTYQKNVNNVEPHTSVKSNSFFVPTHNTSEIGSVDWPAIALAQCLDVYYNKNDACEEFENLRLRYVDRYVVSETATSFTHKIGPSSAKKRMEKLKLQGQSPGTRLSHLANRRKNFSLANLKSSSLLADKSKLFVRVPPKAKSPKKRTSAKKKTPGKRKTPKSAKRLSLAIPESSRASKRALFMSPVEAKPPIKPKEEVLSSRGRFPRRSLFSDNDENNKRRRSSSDNDSENRVGKLRRVESPAKMPKSSSFSIAPSTSGMFENSFNKLPLYRTQSEVVRPSNVAGLGYKKKLTDDIKKKLMWSVSKALNSKQILQSHKDFNEYSKLLLKLVRDAFNEFYNPSVRSVSDQLAKFANLMVSYVIQKRPSNEIYAKLTSSLQLKNATKLTGYIAQHDFDKQLLIKRNSSLLMMSQSQSCSSLNLSYKTESSFDGSSINSSKLSISNASLNRSSSKNNEMLALRENFLGQSGEKSAKKFSGSESNANRLVKSTSSTNLMKAKRQISF